MRDEPIVSISGLVKSYGGRRVVDDLHLEAQPGHIVGLIGTNGAGKTTTVECVQGLRRPDAGRIRVCGVDPVADPHRLRGLVGSQLQSSGLPDRLRVGEAVALFGGTDGAGLLEQFGLSQLHRSAFACLSGGERQRLFLVLALAHQPRLVILDELTQGLDPAARRGVWAAIDQLRQQGTTVLLVTHELDEAEALCDRVVAMRAGRVLDAGSPAELVDRYGRSATITFTTNDKLRSLPLSHLPGVSAVSESRGRAQVTGSRRAIAEVGAALVRAGHVPSDLAVRVPTLEDALVELLGERPPASGGEDASAGRTGRHLVGAAL